MALTISTIRPGVLVPLKTSLHGNVRYDKRDIAQDTTPEGASVVEWETRRTVYDPAEYKAATKVRQKARNLIADVCISTNFGLLCPKDREPQLEAAIKEARRLVREFNQSANITTVRIYVMPGRVAETDEEAIRSISSEIADLMRGMENGIKAFDVKAVREAAKRALQMGQMLTPEMQTRVKEAVSIARTVATKINKAGEVAAREIDQMAIDAIAGKRTAFLDFEDAGEIGPVKGAGRAVAFAVEGEAPATPRVRKRIKLDMADAA